MVSDGCIDSLANVHARSFSAEKIPSKNLEQFHTQPDEYQHESYYDFTLVQVQRPSKLELIEHLTYAVIVRQLNAMNVETSTEPPCKEKVNSVIACFDKDSLTGVAKKVLGLLRYKNIYWQMNWCRYSCVVRVLNVSKLLLSNTFSQVCGKLYTRLLDHCCDVVCNEMKRVTKCAMSFFMKRLW